MSSTRLVAAFRVLTGRRPIHWSALGTSVSASTTRWPAQWLSDSTTSGLLSRCLCWGRGRVVVSRAPPRAVGDFQWRPRMAQCTAGSFQVPGHDIQNITGELMSTPAFIQIYFKFFSARWRGHPPPAMTLVLSLGSLWAPVCDICWHPALGQHILSIVRTAPPTEPTFCLALSLQVNSGVAMRRF